MTRTPDPHPDDGLLLDYATGRLEGEAGRQVELHGASCEACRARLAEIEAVVTHLPAGAVETSRGFDVRLRARLDAIDEARAVPWWRRVGAWALVPVAAGAAATALVLFAPTQPPEPTEVRRSTETAQRDRPGAPTPAPQVALPPADPELLADLALLEHLDAIQLVDVIDDLEAISALPEEG